jgi:hypothetical protein
MGGMTNGSQTDDTDVPADQDDCHVGACDANHMPVQNVKPTDSTCTSGGGKVCGDTAGPNAGKCVQCNDDAQCTSPQVCDPVNGSGVCVDPGCADGVKDGSETDKDCGGSCGATCGDSKMCLADTDCMNGFCNPQSHLCATPSCIDTFKNGAETGTDCGGALCDSQGKTCPDGQGCNTNNDCTHGYCKAGTCTLPTCNDQVQNGNETDKDCGGGSFNGAAACPACAVGQKCNTAGDCASGKCSSNVCVLKAAGDACTANAQCGSGVCGVNGVGFCCGSACTTGDPTCGATACAAGTGACVYPAATTSCGAASCSNGQLTTASTCNGSGTCNAGTTSACPGGVKCASATACLAACSGDTDCQSSSTYCSGGTCVAKGAAGAVCSGANQCTSGICGTTGSGHCCSTSCAAGTANCGATDCNTSGACVYPGTSTVVTSGQTSGDCQQLVCNGSGGVTSANDATDTPTSNTVCLINPTCSGAPLSPSFTPAPTGTDCTADGVAGKTVCGDTSNPLLAGTCVQCNTAANCAAASCSGSTLTPAQTCSATGTCVSGGSAAACPNHLTCASSTACNTTCGSADATGDAKCVSGFYCDGSACQTKLSTGMVCTRDGECSNGSCLNVSDAGPPICN